MNAAFLLVTSACLVGQPAAIQPVGPPAAAQAAVAGSCGPTCGSACHDPCGTDGFGHRLRAKMQGLFQRDSRDNCQPTTCCNTQSHAHARARAPLFNRSSSCDDCGTKKAWSWHTACHSHNHSAPANTCSDSCDRGGLNILGRLRGIFQRGDRHCSGGCNSACGTTSTGTSSYGSGSCGPAAPGSPIPGPAMTPERIDVPKVMPKDTIKPKVIPPVVPNAAKSEVRIETQPGSIPPIVTPTNSIPIVVPGVEVQAVPTPAPAPRVDGDRRDPF